MDSSSQTPHARDIILVAVADEHYGFLRATGEGITALRHPGDPRDALPNKRALAFAGRLAVSESVSVWTMSDGAFTRVVPIRSDSSGDGMRRRRA